MAMSDEMFFRNKIQPRITSEMEKFQTDTISKEIYDFSAVFAFLLEILQKAFFNRVI